MGKIWFTSDQHFGHHGIIRHSNRPWTDAAQMNEAIIENYNNLVGDSDIVYMLGDFAWKGMEDLVWRLNGRIHYIRGNHDKKRMDKPEVAARFDSIQNYLEVRMHGKHLVLFHYPIIDWSGRYRGSWHLYGHTHGTHKQYSGSLEVSVDCCGYRPIEFSELDGLITPFDEKDNIHSRGKND